MMPPRGSGFVLVVVLWFLLALTIAVTAMAAWVSRTVTEATRIADHRELQIDHFSTLHTVKFLLTSHPSRASGLYMGPNPQDTARAWMLDPFADPRHTSGPADLPLRDIPRRGLGSSIFSLQDEAGLINPNVLTLTEMGPLLEWIGVDRSQSFAMARQFDDFTRRVRGLELGPRAALDYELAGLPPPPGRKLLSPLEALRILGWHEHPELRQSVRWRDGVTVLHEDRININSMPDWLLRVAPGMGGRVAAEYAAARRIQPVSGGLYLPEVPGTALDPFRYRAVPGEVMRLTLGNSITSHRTRYHVRLTPGANRGSPWRVELAYPMDFLVDEHSRDFVPPTPVAHRLLAAP